ncbi:MAG: MATE family efflux transporter [Clostridia bacterium]|nr:MATE family efflux transporter [Clostridia bacterium]
MVFSKDKVLYRELFKLSLPIALGSLVTFSISLSDNMIIASLGNEAASSVYLGNQVALLLTMLTAGIEATILVVSSQLLGAEKKEKARRVASLGIIAAVFLGLIFFTFAAFFPEFVLSILTDKSELIESGGGFLRMLGISFLFFAPAQAIAASLRCVKKPKVAFFAALAALAVNIPLNFILIFGKLGFEALGIIGAGIATLVARIVEFSVLFIYAFFVDKELKLKLSSFFRLDKHSIISFFRTGIPVIATQFVWSINSFFASAIMGRQESGGVVAGLSAAIALYNLSYVVTNGMSGAVGVLTGRLVGKGDENARKKLYEYSNTVQLIFIFLGLLTAVFMQATKTHFVSFWGIDDTAREWAFGFINVLSVMVIGTAYQSASLNGLIKSSGEVRFVLKIESFFVFCVIIPLSLLASNLGATPIIIFSILKLDQILKCPVAFVKLRKCYLKSSATSLRIVDCD